VDTIEHPSASIPQAADDAHQAKATYRFYANPRVTATRLRQGFATETARRCLEHDTVLCVQDTTTLNFTPLRDIIPELGPIDSGGLARGVHLHSALALTTTGRILGILDQQYWARPKPGEPCPEEKGSAKWLNGLEAARAVVFATAESRHVPRIIHIADREADTYEMMMAVEDACDSAIIRCVQNRRIDDPLRKAHEAVRNRPVPCAATVPVDHKNGVPQRTAVVQVRSLSVDLVPDLAK
jgi:hypothetical protein